MWRGESLLFDTKQKVCTDLSLSMHYKNMNAHTVKMFKFLQNNEWVVINKLNCNGDWLKKTHPNTLKSLFGMVICFFLLCMANNKQCTWFIPGESNVWSCEVEQIGSLVSWTGQNSIRRAQPAPYQCLHTWLVTHTHTNCEDEPPQPELSLVQLGAVVCQQSLFAFLFCFFYLCL